MTFDFKRYLYVRVRRFLPLQLRTVQNFYLLSFLLSSIICLSFLIPVMLSAGLWIPAWTALVCIIIITICLALWWWHVPIYLVQIIYQSTLMWVILYNAYYSGGITSPVMVWMGVVPILPIFTVSRRLGYVWLFVAFAAVLLTYWVQLHGFIDSVHNKNSGDLALSAVMIGLLCIVQLISVLTYDFANAHALRQTILKNKTLKKLSYELYLANIHKDKFLATVSHEMRTPLNAIMGYLGLLRITENLPTVAASYVQGAENSAAHLVTVINDLLDFSQIQQGKLVFTLQVVDLYKFFKEAHQTLAPKAASLAIEYSLTIDVNCPKWVKVDPHRFTQIYLNLLGNALKFTKAGSVNTIVKYIPNLKNNYSGDLVVQVQDTGIGIPADAIGKVCEPFVQLDSMKSFEKDNSLRGNGLGLSITKSLINNLNGFLNISSKEGFGSLFEVIIPIETSNAPLAAVKSAVIESHTDKVYILLVDDHATNRLVASATIKRGMPNAVIDEARNGTEAIELMKLNKYDLVLMDLIMPDYSGVEVVRIIRNECPPPYCDVKVVALTANLAEDVVENCLRVGIYEVLPKPFNRDALIQAILQSIST
jgi:signal transduction histidine kinase/CheY-like chemotaxis protein